MPQKKFPSFPRAVAERILRRGGEGGPVVITFDKKNGKPTRVFGYDEFQKIRELAKEVKPWNQRKKTAGPDPLGAIDGNVLGRLGRDDIYE